MVYRFDSPQRSSKIAISQTTVHSSNLLVFTECPSLSGRRRSPRNSTLTGEIIVRMLMCFSLPGTVHMNLSGRYELFSRGEYLGVDIVLDE
jgi:hypothetical protein